MTAVVPATGLHEERASVSASGSGATCPLPLGRAARWRKEEDPQAETALRVYRPHPPMRRGHVGEGVGTWRGRTVGRTHRRRCAGMVEVGSESTPATARER